MAGTPQETQPPQPSPTPSSPKAKEAGSYDPPSSSSVTEGSQPHQAPPSDEETKKWGTHIMGPPAAPTVHPDNQKAALWNAGEHQQIYEQPYVVYTPVEKPSHNPFEPVIHMFNTWSKKAETIARNIWHHRKLICSWSTQIYHQNNLRCSV